MKADSREQVSVKLTRGQIQWLLGYLGEASERRIVMAIRKRLRTALEKP